MYSFCTEFPIKEVPSVADILRAKPVIAAKVLNAERRCSFFEWLCHAHVDVSTNWVIVDILDNLQRAGSFKDITLWHAVFHYWCHKSTDASSVMVIFDLAIYFCCVFAEYNYFREVIPIQKLNQLVDQQFSFFEALSFLLQ
uniref:(northern house mosquito) hypothetical protein n=1 Tax=Culex pipiens TaxID=7175 RepID=A0A8D8H336_CULPI